MIKSEDRLIFDRLSSAVKISGSITHSKQESSLIACWDLHQVIKRTTSQMRVFVAAAVGGIVWAGISSPESVGAVRI